MEFYAIDTGWGCGGVWVENGVIVKYPPRFHVFHGQSPKVLREYYMMTKISDKIERKCWNCFEPMEPTDEIANGYNRVFQCTSCKAKFLWVDEPWMRGGSHASKHSIKGAGHSGISLLSDPECDVFGPPKYPPPPGPNDPKRKRIDGKSFRWHEGRRRWVLWE